MDNESTQDSKVVATLEDNALASINDALYQLRRARDLLGNDPRGMGRLISIAITKIEDARYRVQDARDFEGN